MNISLHIHCVQSSGVLNFRFLVYNSPFPCLFFFVFAEQKQRLWADLKSGAESGWDFTSRWYIDGSGQNSGTLRETRTSQILPTDLNALLCRCESTLASFHRIVGERTRSSPLGLGSARAPVVVT